MTSTKTRNSNEKNAGLRAAIAALALLVALAPAPLFAAPVYFQFGTEVAVDTLGLNYLPDGVNSAPGYPGTFYVGQYTALMSPNPSLSPSEGFYTFCVDLAHEVNNGQEYMVDIRSTSDGLTNGAQVAYLYNTYGTSLITDATAVGSSVSSGNDYAAALQLAIWDEVSNNGVAPYAGGPFQYTVSGDIAAQVQFFLTDASTHSSVAQWADSNVPQVGYTQGQGFLVPLPHQVPEPSTITLVGLALGCAAFGWRRRAK